MNSIFMGAWGARAASFFTVALTLLWLVAVPIDEATAQTKPTVTVTAGTSPVTEGGDAVFTVTADPAPSAALEVELTVSASGDYGVSAGTQTITIPATGSAPLTLATAGDGTDEADGSVTVTVADGDGYTVGDPASGTVAVRDDDEPPVLVSVDDAEATEGDEAALMAFTVRLSRPASGTVAPDGRLARGRVGPGLHRDH